MNNAQFRRLLIDTPKQQDGAENKSPPSRTPGAVLGARKQSAILMTPRQVGRHSVQAEFTRQLAERNAKRNGAQKFKSSAPKGTKLAAGYTDRTQERKDDDDTELGKRVKNLEESYKRGEIDRDTFHNSVQELTGGDITTTHLVRGLDRKLLERQRKGELLTGDKPPEDEDEDSDIEDEFDALAEEEIAPIVAEKVEKKGVAAPPPPVAGVKRNRNDILAELKRQREEAAAAEHEKLYPSLGAGFRRIGAKGEPRIERDSKGREVLITVDADGKEKRKVRKQKPKESPSDVRPDPEEPTLEGPPKTSESPEAKETPGAPQQKEESEDEDIFAGVGSNYNPLANLESEDESSDEEGETKASQPEDGGTEKEEKSAATPAKAPVSNEAPAPKRNYFESFSRTMASKDPDKVQESAAVDATVRAALQKVRTLDPDSSLINDPDSKEARLKKRAAELAARDRDMDDIDMGFGESRFDDADEMEREGEKVKFSQWKGAGAEDDDEDERSGKGAKKRKRGPKKKKGDKNSASDVLKVMEQQKERKKLG